MELLIINCLTYSSASKRGNFPNDDSFKHPRLYKLLLWLLYWISNLWVEWISRQTIIQNKDITNFHWLSEN